MQSKGRHAYLCLKNRIDRKMHIVEKPIKVRKLKYLEFAQAHACSCIQNNPAEGTWKLGTLVDSMQFWIILQHQLTLIGVEVAHSTGHVHDGRERLGDVSIRKDDLTTRLVSLRPLQWSRQHHGSLEQYENNGYPKHVLNWKRWKRKK